MEALRDESDWQKIDAVAVILDDSKGIEAIKKKLRKDDLGHSFEALAEFKNFATSVTCLEWFASYLADRTWRVTVNNGQSSAFPLREGVPQGSCLGPLLFTVYTSKLFDIVSKHLPSVHCYADDTQLYLAFSPDVQGEDEAALNAMRDCIHDLRNWMIEDRLMLNDDKTELMLISTVKTRV